MHHMLGKVYLNFRLSSLSFCRSVCPRPYVARRNQSARPLRWRHAIHIFQSLRENRLPFAPPPLTEWESRGVSNFHCLTTAAADVSFYNYRRKIVICEAVNTLSHGLSFLLFFKFCKNCHEENPAVIECVITVTALFLPWIQCLFHIV